MTKSELVDAIAAEAGLSKADSERALKACTGAIEGALKKGDSISLIGFGTFSVVQRAARTGRNPREPAFTFSSFLITQEDIPIFILVSLFLS